jgi:hypothetical protein
MDVALGRVSPSSVLSCASSFPLPFVFSPAGELGDTH